MTRGLGLLCLLTAAACVSPPQLAFQEGFSHDVHDPIWAVSPSAKAKLWVNPSHPSAAGPGQYRLTVDGKEAWDKTLPFTFFEAGVSDDGTSAGFALTEGDRREGELVIAIIDRSGSVTFEERTGRKRSRMMHSDPDPGARGLVFDAANDRFVVRIDAENGWNEEWRFYSLSGRKRTKSLTVSGIDGENRWRIADARPLPGTDLFLLNWELSNYRDQSGQAFELINDEGVSVWRKNLPADFYTGVKEKDWEIRRDALDTGTILAADKPKQFEVRFVAEGQCVTFEIDKGLVSEVSRRRYVAPMPPKFSAPEVTLTAFSQVKLPGVTAAPADVRDVGEFHIWDGKFVFVRSGAPKAFCVADTAGKLIRKVYLPKEAQETNEIFLAKTAGSQFVVVATQAGEKDASAAWRVDAVAGQIEPLPAFKSYWVRSVAGFPDGRFAVLSSDMGDNSMATHVALHAADGKVLWDKEENGYSGAEEEMLSPEDLDVDGQGRLVVLDNIAHKLQAFDASGKYLSTLDLDKIWGREASYPTQVTCLPDGGYWLYDFGGERPCIRLKSDGKIAAEFKPAFASGKPFESRQALRVDAKGQSWITNETALHQIDAKGKVVQTVGNATRLTGLGTIADIYVAPDGRTYAVDDATNEVHVFDASGKSLFVAKPDAKDFDDQAGASLTVTQSGDIYVSGANPPGDLHFSPTGERIGVVDILDNPGPDAPFVMKPSYRWWGHRLVDEKGKTVARLRRWPDQAWMQGGPSTMAPDGRLMSYGDGDWARKTPESYGIGFFDASGNPEGQVPFPAGLDQVMSCAYDGTFAYFLTEKGLAAVDRKGKVAWFYKPGGLNWECKVFVSKGRLALFDGARTVRWLDLPK